MTSIFFLYDPTQHARRIEELESLAKVEGFELPYRAARIARLEESGAVVDLITGAIEINGAETRIAIDYARAQAWLGVA